MCRRALRASAAPAALAALLVLAAGARADKFTPGQKAYMEGVSAYNNADYEGAASKLREAVREDPNEGLAKFQYTGLNKEDYLPHFYLGLSLDKLKQGEEALKHLRESQRQKVIKGRSSLNRILENALRRLEPVAVVAEAAPPTPVPVAPTAVPTRPPPPPTQPPRPTPTFPVAAPPTPVKEIAKPEVKPEVKPEAKPTRPEEVQAEAAATRTPRGEGKGSSLPPDVVAAVREGIRSFFKGDFSSAVRQLEPEAEKAPVARLFLAYSLASTQLLSSGRDPAVLDRARREYQTARKQGAAPREEMISPGVRSLLSGGK